MKFSTLIIIFTIIIYGILLGGIVYSHIVYFPVFLSDLPGSAVLVNGKYPLHEEKFWMFIHPILLVVFVTTIIFNWKNKPRIKKILISLGIYIIVLIVSAIYFIPELITFAGSGSSALPASEWLVRSKSWFIYSILRGIIMLAAIFPLFMALLKPPAIKKAQI